MTIAARPQGLSDVAAGRLDREDHRRQFRRPASAAEPARGQSRGGALLLLLRRALPAGLPDLDRHSLVHPPDRRRQPHGRGEDDLRRQHPGRHVRPRLPDRDAVRGGLRARGRRRQAGADRAPAALRHRRADRDRAVALPARRADRKARGDRRRGPGGPRLRACARGRGRRSHDLRGAREARRPQRIRHRRLQDGRRLRRQRRPPSSCRSAASRCSTASRSASTSSSTSSKRDYDAVFLGHGTRRRPTSSACPARPSSRTSSTRSTTSRSCVRRRTRPRCRSGGGSSSSAAA